MKNVYYPIEDFISSNPCDNFPVDIIPNRMGINLFSVDGISFVKQEDDQLICVKIHFRPSRRMNKMNIASRIVLFFIVLLFRAASSIIKKGSTVKVLKDSGHRIIEFSSEDVFNNKHISRMIYHAKVALWKTGEFGVLIVWEIKE